MFNIILGSVMAICLVGAVGAFIVALTDPSNSMESRRFGYAMNAFCCFAASVIVCAVIACFVLILGG